jgi:DHA1 family multidrug resistance protein-like MFS transporter
MGHSAVISVRARPGTASACTATAYALDLEKLDLQDSFTRADLLAAAKGTSFHQACGTSPARSMPGQRE